MKWITGLLMCGILASPLAAHPHIFVDTGFELILGEAGEVAQVRVTWEYDEFYSLLVTEDMGLDTDYDGVLTAKEQTALTGFDMRWVQGFNGDLVMTQGEEDIALSGPQEVTATFKDGRITTTHIRTLGTAVPPGTTLVMKAYDPTYYTAYEVTRPVSATGSGTCEIRLKGPEGGGASEAVQQQLAALDAASDPADAGLPDIGAAMAGSVIVTCAAS